MLVLVVPALVVLLGFAGLVLDTGRIYVAQRQLQPGRRYAGGRRIAN